MFRYLGVISLLLMCACASGTSDRANSDPGPLPTQYQAIVKRWLDENLKDPHSIQDLTISSPSRATAWTGLLNRGSVEAWVVCVGYNAKNSYGGYVGKKYYRYYIQNNAILETTTGPFILDGC